MKNLTAVLLGLALLTACGTPAADEEATFPTFSFQHFASGGADHTETAVILFEQSNSTFTSYQVAFPSCTCRDAMVNYLSVAYVELLNNKENPDDAAIRSLSFGNNQGMWGDSNPNYYIAEYTQEYMDEYLVQPLVKATKADLDAWEGYGTWVDGINVDAVAGATVSSSNLQSMLRGLFAYHTEHYYQTS